LLQPIATLSRHCDDDQPRGWTGTGWARNSGARFREARSVTGRSKRRPDPVQLIIESHNGRLDWLIPVRVGRMTATPYGFLRGAAVVMAEDVARLPSTGITPVICGDAHLGNFGFYASPEQDLVIDLNDFDEAHPRRMGVGSSPPGSQHLGRGPPERRQRPAVRIGGPAVRGRIPGRGPRSGLDTAAGPVLSAHRPRPLASEHDGQIAAGRDQAGRSPSAPQDQRPGAAQVRGQGAFAVSVCVLWWPRVSASSGTTVARYGRRMTRP
jgi:Uncharacterized protein conserved in bacteria (DUF2252)